MFNWDKKLTTHEQYISESSSSLDIDSVQMPKSTSVKIQKDKKLIFL